MTPAVAGPVAFYFTADLTPEDDRRISAAVARAVTPPRRPVGPVLVAIDGPSGAGKSEAAQRLVVRLRARGITTALVSTDDFATWDEPVQWWPRLEAEVLTPLTAGRPACYRPWSWTELGPVPGEPRRLAPAAVLLLEGVSSARLALWSRLHVAAFLDVATAEQRWRRAVARDGEESRAHLRQWQRDEERWFSADGTRARFRAGLG